MLETVGEVEGRLADMGLELPSPPRPIGNYLPAVQVGNILYVSGTLGTVRDENDEDIMPIAGKLGGDLPADGLRPAGDLLGGGAAQAPARREERDGLQDAGLASAIGPPKRHGAAIEGQLHPLMRAEMRQGQRCDMGGRWGHGDGEKRRATGPGPGVTRASA